MSARARIYLALAVVGAIAAAVITGCFIAEYGVFDFEETVDQLFASQWSVLLLADLTVAVAAFWVWMWREAPRIGLSPWLFVALTLLVGLFFALSLFLYFRERRAPAPV